MMKSSLFKRVTSVLLAIIMTALTMPVGATVAFADDDVDVELGWGDAPDEWIDGCDNHKWDAGKVTLEPECSRDGEKTYTCTVCDATKIEVIPATEGHIFGAWTKYDGVQHVRECENGECGVKEYEAHKWNNGTVVSDANCGEDGEILYTCTECGATKTETVEKTGEHKWNDGEITTEPTCASTGVRTYTCTVCSETKTETVNKTNHEYGEWTRQSSTQHMRKCKNPECTAKEYAAHVWGEGEITTPPTALEEGVRTYTCSDCGAEKTEKIDKLPLVCGDVNGDGVVTQLDSFFLARHIAEWEGYEAENINYDACDLNSDGVVTQLDSFILARHIAEWEGYENLPINSGNSGEGGDDEPDGPDYSVGNWDMTYEEYTALSAAGKLAQYQSFASAEDYFTWFNNAKKEYEDAQGRIEIGEGGNIELGGGK